MARHIVVLLAILSAVMGTLAAPAGTEEVQCSLQKRQSEAQDPPHFVAYSDKVCLNMFHRVLILRV